MEDDVDQSLSQLLLEVSGLCLEGTRSGAGCFLQVSPPKPAAALHTEHACVDFNGSLPGWGEPQGRRGKLGRKSVFCDSRTSTGAAALHSLVRGPGPLPLPLLSLLLHCSFPLFPGEMAQDRCVCWGSGAGGQLGFISAKKLLFFFFPPFFASPSWPAQRLARLGYFAFISCIM